MAEADATGVRRVGENATHAQGTQRGRPEEEHTRRTEADIAETQPLENEATHAETTGQAHADREQARMAANNAAEPQHLDEDAAHTERAEQEHPDQPPQAEHTTCCAHGEMLPHSGTQRGHPEERQARKAEPQSAEAQRLDEDAPHERRNVPEGPERKRPRKIEADPADAHPGKVTPNAEGAEKADDQAAEPNGSEDTAAHKAPLHRTPAAKGPDDTQGRNGSIPGKAIRRSDGGTRYGPGPDTRDVGPADARTTSPPTLEGEGGTRNGN